jgi:DNA-binding GntR family transcriptional regulator
MVQLQMLPHSGSAFSGPAVGTRVAAGNVYDYLKDQLLSYNFRPGERLVVADLADRLLVSSTPVREALSRLNAEGLLVSIPNKGFFAKSLSVREMTDLFEFGYLLLHGSVESAAARGKAIVPEALLPALDGHGATRGDSPRSRAQFVEDAFHRIASLSENREVIRATRSFCERTHCVRALDLEDVARLEEVDRDMDELMRFLIDGQSSKAIENIRRQFDRQHAQLAGLVKETINRLYTTLALSA